MGGLMRRKNRSMPDLREDQDIVKDSPIEPPTKEVSKDDSMLNSNVAIQSNLSGYLSEGNLEYAGNPNLERSKLMRKSFHASKILQFNKVPPPPPLRTTSQLSKNDRQYQDPSPPQQRSMEQQVYANHRSWCQEPASLPYMPRGYETEKPKTDAITYSNGGYMLHDNSGANTVVTEAQVHHEPPFQSLPPSIDEPDFVSVNKPEDLFQLPPYPSPHGSTVHSRQASEDFPPPPATLPLPPEVIDESSFLSMLQEKRDKLMASMKQDAEEPKKTTGGESWLKELQAKQAERRKCIEPAESKGYSAPVPENKNNFKDLKSKFEQLHVEDEPKPAHYPSCLKDTLQTSRSSPNLRPDEIDDKGGFDNREPKRKSGKKKNVTFCEQVVLVATADDDEGDSYIPNPILERVLRTVLNKEPKEVEVQERAIHSVVPLKRTDSWKLSQGLPLKPYPEGDAVDGVEPQKEAAKQMQNSMKMVSDMAGKPPLGRTPSSNDCPPDEVDGPSFSAPPMTQYGLENGRNGQGVRNGGGNSFNNVPANSYGPTYIPASSLCSSTNKNNDSYRNEYPEPISLQNEASHNSYNGYANNDYYADQNSNSNDNYVSSHNRKFDAGFFWQQR
ncbi:ubiquitinyl hydrolase [Sarracenia purpurea var. burkii]